MGTWHKVPYYLSLVCKIVHNAKICMTNRGTEGNFILSSKENTFNLGHCKNPLLPENKIKCFCSWNWMKIDYLVYAKTTCKMHQNAPFNMSFFKIFRGWHPLWGRAPSALAVHRAKKSPNYLKKHHPLKIPGTALLYDTVYTM